MIGYVTLEEAREIILARYDYTGTDEELSRALHLALDKIESIPIRNSGRSKTQQLNFPRIGEDSPPASIKLAQCLEAYKITRDGNREDDEVTSRSIGDMSVSYGPRNGARFNDEQAYKLLTRYERRTYGWN